MTNSIGLYIGQGGNFAVAASTTNAFGLVINAPQGATNNYVASTSGKWIMNNLTTAANKNAVCIDATTKEIVDSGGSTCAGSSERFKENIQTLSSGTALSILDQLRVVSFDYKTGDYGSDEKPQSLGLIAEEVAKIDPRLVDYGYDGLPETLHFERLTGLTIQAVQELDARTKFAQTLNATASTTLVMKDGAGHVGIGTNAPIRALDVIGDIGATGSISTGALTAGTVTVPNTQTSYVFGTTTLATVMPTETLTASGDVDLYKLATYTLGSVEALATRMDALSMKLDSLAERLQRLEDGSIAVVGTTTFSTTTLATAFNDLGAYIQNGVAQFGTLVFHQLVAARDADGVSSAGNETILAGNTVLEVQNRLVKPSSKIFVTFTSPIDGAWYISEKKDGSFRVTLEKAQSSDISFDFFILQTEGQIATPAGATSTPLFPETHTIIYQNTPTSTPTGTSTNSGTGSTTGTTPTVSSDTVPPSLILTGAAAINVTVGGTWTDPGATATDDVDGEISGQIMVSGTVDTATAGLYTVNYSVADHGGNEAHVSRVVTVTAPAAPAPAPTPAPVDPTPAPAESPAP
jgi:hypothetical protein